MSSSSRTQSVCKHCGRPIKSGEYCRRHRNAEPISESASTGEPPPLEQIFEGRFNEYWTPELENSLLQKMLVRRAARPSEPSAPHAKNCVCIPCLDKSVEKDLKNIAASQTSAIIGKGYIELDQMIENLAAPQPVSASHRNFICPTDEMQCDWPKCVDPKSGDSYFDAECLKRMNAVSGDAPKTDIEKKYLIALRWFKLFYNFYQEDIKGKPSAAMSAMSEDGELQELLRETNRTR